MFHIFSVHFYILKEKEKKEEEEKDNESQKSEHSVEFPSNNQTAATAYRPSYKSSWYNQPLSSLHPTPGDRGQAYSNANVEY